MLGCEVQEDNSFRGFWEYHCAGEPLLAYLPENETWKPLPSSFQPLAEKMKQKWDVDEDRPKDYRHRVQGDMCKKLQHYLRSWKTFHEQTEPPAVSVTCNRTTEHTTGLTCCALAVSPGRISPTWLHDGQPLTQHNQSRWGDLSSGNGTCVSTEVPLGEERTYSCQVELGRNSSAHPVPCGMTSLPKYTWTDSSVILGAVVGGGVGILIVCVWLGVLKKRRTSGQQSPGEETTAEWWMEGLHWWRVSSHLPLSRGGGQDRPSASHPRVMEMKG
ncbi:MHC class I polypeptide-related sequence B-like isoform X1 [Echinops telfairi]|uniref:MHC class I polypeptide-related sequence B-like isoform X1 n=1 Tax=Echinops telfairi TaxID=9371 RepID=A0AC55DAE2_ECHTE|nr:MHC class I polypeptide-related sequence B-like isoform X1 [Echinops telfairi]